MTRTAISWLKNEWLEDGDALSSPSEFWALGPWLLLLVDSVAEGVKPYLLFVDGSDRHKLCAGVERNAKRVAPRRSSTTRGKKASYEPQ